MYDDAFTKMARQINLQITNNILLGKSPVREVDHVIFNGKATIVFWSNGDKTVTKCSSDDTFDKKMGFLMAYFRYHTGLTKTQTAKTLKRICKDREE